MRKRLPRLLRRARVVLVLLAAGVPDGRAAETGRLVAVVAFPLEVRGQPVGEMKLPPETPVVILGREEGRVFLQSRAGAAWAEESAVRITGEKVEFPPIPEPGFGEPRGGWQDNARGEPLRPSTGIFKGLPRGEEDVPSSNADFEADVLHMVNAERRKKGLGELAWSEDLARAARYHAADMAADEYFCHDTRDRVLIDGRPVLRRVAQTSVRLKAFYPAPNGENIARGQRTPGQVMRSWMSSTGHRQNILRKDSKALGVGYVRGIWVQVFGR
jgi:uncharacterized protein YkwD